MKQPVTTRGILRFLTAIFSVLVASGQATPVETPLQPTAVKGLKKCDCFTVSGPGPGYFQHYKLWDFRSVPLRAHSAIDLSEASSDDEDDSEDWYNEEDDDVQDEEDSEGDFGDNALGLEYDALSFSKTAFDKDWASQGWQRPRSRESPVDMVNSKRNVFFTRNRDSRNPGATYLVLRTIRHDNFTSTAEIETRVRNIYHCSLRVRLRILPGDVVISQPSQPKQWPPWDPRQHPIPRLNNHTSLLNGTTPVEEEKPHPGACVGIFTYHARNSESDIEILTSDPPNRIRYANQPDYDPITDKMIPGASSIIDLPVPWTTWSTHRLDWLAGSSRWWVDDEPQVANAYQVPAAESRLVINLWSDGGEWTGDMRLGDSVYLGIEYIELAYNRSSDAVRQAIPSPSRHGAHQNASMSVAEAEELEEELWEPETDALTGTAKKRKKCKKGKKGRKCRKKHGGKHRKGSQCRRPCNVDELRLAEVGVRP